MQVIPCMSYGTEWLVRPCPGPCSAACAACPWVLVISWRCHSRDAQPFIALPKPSRLTNPGVFAQAWAPATPQPAAWQAPAQQAWQPPGAQWAPQAQPLPPPPSWQAPSAQQPGAGAQQGCGNVAKLVLDALVGYLKKRFGGGK